MTPKNIKIIIYVDMDDVICDYSRSHEKALKMNPHIKYPQSQYGFFRTLPAILGALNSVEYLNFQKEFDVYILTAPSIKNPLCYIEKRLWVEDNLGIEMVKKLIISPNKGLNKGDYLIDDHTSGKGQENFEGEILKFGSKNFNNWEQILNYFKGKYELK